MKDRLNLYLNIVTCSLVVCIGLFLVAVGFLVGGVLTGLFAMAIGLVPIAAFTKDIYDNIKKFEEV